MGAFFVFKCSNGYSGICYIIWLLAWFIGLLALHCSMSREELLILSIGLGLQVQIKGLNPNFEMDWWAALQTLASLICAVLWIFITLSKTKSHD